MSLETTLARADADRLARAWKQHRAVCAACTAGARRRDRAGMCAAGILLRATWQQAAAELERQRVLDEAPIDGQGELF